MNEWKFVQSTQNLKQNEVQNACSAESTNEGVNEHTKDVTQTAQQRPESPTVTLTWHGSKCKGTCIIYKQTSACVTSDERSLQFVASVHTKVCVFTTDYEQTNNNNTSSFFYVLNSDGGCFTVP